MALLVGLVLAAGCLGGNTDGEAPIDDASAGDENAAGERTDDGGEGDQAPSEPEDEDEGEEEGESTADRDPEPSPTVHAIEETVSAEALNAGADDAQRAIEMDVPEDATGLVAEMTWSGEDADLDLHVLAPRFPCERDTLVAAASNALFEPPACWMLFHTTGDSFGGSFAGHYPAEDGSGASSMRVVLGADVLDQECTEEHVDEGACPWEGFARIHRAADASFTLAVAVFEQAPPPDGYSPLDAAGG